MKWLVICLLAISSAFLAGGCASSNVNPAVARPNTGYVDFYVTITNDLFWDVTDMASNRKVFSKFRPLGEPILRLAFTPGQYQFQVTFLNRVIAAPGTVNVDARDGMVTPVLVTLPPVGPAAVHSRSTYFGLRGRTSRVSRTETVNYNITAEPQPPLPYRPKEQMPYFIPPS
ncbi:MAG TPA: hypothetical protein VMF08_14695 [Candidatus Sulfotelmatobacter sp.]|nr:hypothetical protein [Candidatus Sulfotelmatobacter sp.]